MAHAFDLLLRRGRVIDPAADRDGIFDVAINGDRIAAIDHRIPAESGRSIIDATGLVVVPGLVDLHTHIYFGATYLGVDGRAIVGLSGVTTWVDAGSAGAFTFPAFRTHIIEESEATVRAFVNISYVGMVGLNYDEYCNIRACDPDVLERVIDANRDVIVGVKVRMGTGRIGNQGLEPLRLAREAATRARLPLMVHIAAAPPQLRSILRFLNAGDILTHAFTGLSERIVDARGILYADVRRARERGVLLDVGHGAGSFSFRTAEALAATGEWPDVISSDLNALSIHGPKRLSGIDGRIVVDVEGDGAPAFTLLSVMSKFLNLGMDLRSVIRAVTATPSSAVGLNSTAGALRVGDPADIAMLRVERGRFREQDVEGQERDGAWRISIVRTILRGRILDSRDVVSLPPWVRTGFRAARIR